MASEHLERRVKRYRENLFARYGRRNRAPKVVIGAQHFEICKVDHSGQCPTDIAPKLERELVKIAPLGEKGHDNYVGCCCEVRASNQIILLRPSAPIAAIAFTKALRTRTGEPVRRCRNCREVFGNGI